jgi:hypothetical protein
MNSSFQFVAMPYERFEPLFSLSDEELRAMNARRMIVDDKPGYPCRVSLVDAEVGETVILLPFTYHDVSSPYLATGPIYVRSGATTAVPENGEIPDMFDHRLLSVRGYDTSAMLVGAEIVKGNELGDGIQGFFDNEEVSYLHIHNAGQGCFLCRVVRA